MPSSRRQRNQSQHHPDRRIHPTQPGLGYYWQGENQGPLHGWKWLADQRFQIRLRVTKSDEINVQSWANIIKVEPSLNVFGGCF